MRKKIILCVAALILCSCTVYTEKQSQSLSRAVYATKDSLEVARVDLASEYATEASRIVKPPKEKIEISPLYKTSTNEDVYYTKSDKQQRILVVPEKYKNDTVIVVNSEEYQQLLKDKKILEQIKKENKSLSQFKIEVDEELAKQEQYANKMVQDLNRMQKQLVEKDLAILKRNIVIVVMGVLMGGGIYLRMKGIL